MFTGIVEEIGSVSAITNSGTGYEMTFKAARVLQGTQIGDSIAVNGTCLTVTVFDADHFKVGVAPESLQRTNLGQLKVGDPVNLERAVTPSTRLGGHIVQGHVDGTGTVLEKRRDRESLWVTIKADPEVMRYIVPKGFICLDGVSLTVVDVWPDRFNIMLVAHTQEHIILPQKPTGYRINIEVDIVGKYVEKFMVGHRQAHGITPEMLAENGFT